MAKKTNSPPPPERPECPAQGLELLSRQIVAAEELLNARSIPKEQYSSWELVTKNFLEKAFGVNSPNVSSIVDVGKYGSFPRGADEVWWENHRRLSLTNQVSKLRGLVEVLKTEVQLQNTGVLKAGIAASAGRRIFLVHGHDDSASHETARFLEKLELQVLILRELPNGGRTIIEKFEEYSNVGFAVVLLTPDDRGGSAGTRFEEQQSRARQNVIFELGYFIGRLGRNRVCALYRPGVEIPSDYTGVLYVELDGGWKLELAKELNAANLSVDMNKAL